jgi:hypothetical protein
MHPDGPRNARLGLAHAGDNGSCHIVLVMSNKRRPFLRERQTAPAIPLLAFQDLGL